MKEGSRQDGWVLVRPSWVRVGEERTGKTRKKEAYFVFFCIYLRVAVSEPLHMHGENLTHTYTHTHTQPKRRYGQCTRRVHASSLQTEEWILFQA